MVLGLVLVWWICHVSWVMWHGSRVTYEPFLLAFMSEVELLSQGHARHVTNVEDANEGVVEHSPLGKGVV